MPKFELEKLTNYDDQALIAELKQIAGIVPSGKLTRSEFDRLSKVHPSTYCKRFGSWRKTLEMAGLSQLFDDSNHSWSREEIIEPLKTVSTKLGRTTITARNLREHTGICTVHRIFGSFGAALKAAGLAQSPIEVRYTDEECYENLLTVWTALGRQPSFAEMKSPPSRVGTKAYISRWGGWRKALKAFVERMNQDAPLEEAPKPESKSSNSKSLVRKRTLRDIPPGLKFKVICRDGNRCRLCGKSPITHSVSVEIDHVIPWSKRGETVLKNLRVLCDVCNRGRGASMEDLI